jgi:glycosyltransferase involved in cell wall biosynthesis
VNGERAMQGADMRPCPHPMRVSVIATVRNESATITAFLDSLIGQSLRPDEIVIVDGASTDGTLEILDDYAARHGVRVISQPCNIAQGRNLGIAAATGTHIAVTDAGCRVDADWLQEIVGCFTAHPEADVVAGNFRFETHSAFEEAVVLATFPPNRDDTEGARVYPSSRSVAFTKAAWERAGGYPEWLYAAEDTLFNIRLRQVGCQFVFCRNAIVRWRPRENWHALARQRINFARGNARVGIGSSGYLLNLRVHGLAVALLLGAAFHWALLVGAALVLGWHVRRHLWPQAVRATEGRPRRLRYHTVAVMEFVRLVSMYGFLLGRWDRLRDSRFVSSQQRYMGVRSVQELEARGVV